MYNTQLHAQFPYRCLRETLQGKLFPSHFGVESEPPVLICRVFLRSAVKRRTNSERSVATNPVPELEVRLLVSASGQVLRISNTVSECLLTLIKILHFCVVNFSNWIYLLNPPIFSRKGYIRRPYSPKIGCGDFWDPR